MIKPQLKEFMRRIDKDSVAIIPAAREAVRSHDTNYRYRQNSDFFYLTGFEEPEAIAVIAPSRDKKFTLFVRPRDLDQEIWYGYRAGVEGAQRDYSADEAFTIDQFEQKLTEILDGPRVLYYAFGHTDAAIDQKIIQQLAMMRESNRKPFEPPTTIIDPSTILHEMRVLKSRKRSRSCSARPTSPRKRTSK
jgi:Xaa-Pro aminopeptidase